MGANDLAKTTDIDLSVRRWGNSLAVRLPAGLAKQLGVSEGDRLALHAEGHGKWRLSNANSTPKPLLSRAELLAELEQHWAAMPVTQPVSKDEWSSY